MSVCMYVCMYIYIYILLDVLLCSIAEYFTRCLYFDEPVGLVKIRHNSYNQRIKILSDTTQQNVYRRFIIQHSKLFNTLNCYVRGGEFRGYLFTGNA